MLITKKSGLAAIQTETKPDEPPPADKFPGLKESVEAILLGLNQGYLKVPDDVPKNTATQAFGYAARQLITNFEVHLGKHSPGFLECWMRNHLRAIIHPLDRGSTNNASSTLPLYDALILRPHA